MTATTDLTITATSADFARLDKAVGQLLTAASVPGEVQDVTVSVLPAVVGDLRLHGRRVAIKGATDKVVAVLIKFDRMTDDINVKVKFGN